MPQFVDHPLPASLVLPRLQAPRPRDKRLDNLQRNGRPKGAQDKITKDLKLGLIEGAVQAGFDGEGTGGLIGYCKWMAMFHPKAYATLLVKLLPYNIHANTESQPHNHLGEHPQCAVWLPPHPGADGVCAARPAFCDRSRADARRARSTNVRRRGTAGHSQPEERDKRIGAKAGGLSCRLTAR